MFYFCTQVKPEISVVLHTSITGKVSEFSYELMVLCIVIFPVTIQLNGGKDKHLVRKILQTYVLFKLGIGLPEITSE